MSLFESPRTSNSLQDNQSSNNSNRSSNSTVDLLHSSSDDDQDDDASIQTEYKEIQCKECHSEQVVDSDEIIYKKHYWFDSVEFPTIDDVTTNNTASSMGESRDRTTTATAAVVTHSGKKRRRTENTHEYDLTNQLRLDHFSTPDRNRNGTHQYTLTGNEDTLQETTRNGNISSQIKQRNQEAPIENEESNSTIVNGTTIASPSQPQNRSNNKETRQSDDVIELLESDTEQPTNETRSNRANSNRNIIELLDSDNEDPPTMSQRVMDRIHNRRKRNRQRNRNHRHRGSATSYAATAIDVDLTLE